MDSVGYMVVEALFSTTVGTQYRLQGDNAFAVDFDAK